MGQSLPTDQETVLRRNSGCQAQACFYKTGPNMPEQGYRMMRASNVFAPVIEITKRGYLMPVLEPFTAADNIEHLLNALQDLWTATAGSLVCSRAAYMSYVLSKEAPPELLCRAVNLYKRTEWEEGRFAETLHGDATIENAMVHNGTPVWIDPSTRPMPQEAELDIGKLLQSCYGYHPMSEEQRRRVLYFCKAAGNWNLSLYYLVTHLVRLWAYQPKKHEWALKVAKEVSSET